MPLPRFRFSVRRMMVAVAVVAIVMGADNMRRRRDRWRELGFRHQMGENSNLRLAKAHSETAAQDEAGAESHRAAAAAAHVDRTVNEEMHSGFAAAFAAQAAKERDGERKHLTLASFHGELRRKYERAARYPWLPVAPDPPEPE
jgi:hypothetical protein